MRQQPDAKPFFTDERLGSGARLVSPLAGVVIDSHAAGVAVGFGTFPVVVDQGTVSVGHRSAVHPRPEGAASVTVLYGRRAEIAVDGAGRANPVILTDTEIQRRK